MIHYRYLKKRIKDVKLKDYIAFIPMFVALICIPLFKKRYEKVWLICERQYEARDNGYYFFKYVVENHPNQKVIYALSKKSADYAKVAKLGTIVSYGGLKHWILYFTCQLNISSQKSGKPNAPICAFLELSNISKTDNIFLQHGIIINDVDWLHSDKCRFKIFITSTIPETEFIKEKFSYKDDVVKMTGLPRFDNLHQFHVEKNTVLIMPTWRDWFRFSSKREKSRDADFSKSEYLRMWKELLNSSRLNDIIKRYDLKVIFYPHSEIQNYISEFSNINERIQVASRNQYCIQELLKKAAMLITDYSSVFFDMVYMKKPVLFYQFDETKYRNFQYKKGYFDYFNNPFGKSYKEIDDVLEELEKIVIDDFQVNQEYLEEHERIFKNYDAYNSDRVYEEIEKFLNGNGNE